MLVGPSLGWAQEVEAKTASFSEPLDDAQSARVSLNLGVANTTVNALTDSSDLFSADLTYIGDVEFVAEGETNKVISLSQTNEDNSGGFNFFGIPWFAGDQQLTWDVALSPDVPIDLSISGGVGDANLDLSQLQITGLNLSSGVGKMDLNLPSSGEPYEAQLSSGVGEVNLNIPEGSNVNLDIHGGVGEFAIDVPDNAGVHLEADSGVGGINVPSNFTRTGGDDEDNFIGESGTWETEEFANADQKITIIFNGGVGELTVK
jgi:hypothetical protein